MGRIPGRRTVLALAAGLLAFPAAAAARPAAGPDAKLDSALTGLVRADGRGASVAAAADARELTVTPGERVLTEIYARTTEATAERRLETAGAEVRATAAGPGDLAVVTAWVPVRDLEAVAAAAGVQAVLPVQAYGTDAGAKTSQGVAAHQVPQPPPAGANGAGVKVGVISDSIDQRDGGIADSQATGDLPASVSALSDQPGATDEGRAMAEIIYDMAPGITEMAFASGTVAGAAGKVAAIDGLVAAGAKVIADDIFYVSEPFFQDGQVAQAVDRARDAGVLYLASAGNRARQSYESAPRFPAGDGALHDFDAGAGTDTTQGVVTVPHNAATPRNLQVTLQWDEPWGQAKHDIDISIVRLSDGAELASATTDNISTGLPIETVSFTNATGAAVPVGVRITRFGPAPGAADLTLMKYIARGNFGSFTVAEHDTSSDAINPDAAAAKGSLAVAAIKHDEPGLNDPEPFSSRGPKQRFFDKGGVRLPTPETRQKPEIAAADGVSTTVSTFPTFFGTSAAVPSAAGIAALALSAKPTMPLSLLRAVMTDPRNSNDCTLAGLPDLDCGWGFVLAGRAVAMAQDTTPPTATPVRSPGTPTGTNGWYRGDVSVTWNLADAQSPAERVSGCAPATRTTDGQGAVSCTARSVGGTVTESTVLKRDATAPTLPTFAGITATTFTPAAVPAAGAISCASTDATSGMASCVVTGHSADPGSHTLTATATDHAGNTRTATLTYFVGPPLITRTITPSAPTGQNGWWTGDVTVSWVVNALAPVTPTGCGTVSHTTDGLLTSSCSATNSAGPATAPDVVLRRDATPPDTPVIAGIAATTYAVGAVPAAGGISCSSADATSGLQGCSVTGYDVTVGTHTLTATARDNAGLQRTATLTYTVAAPPADAAPAASGPLVAPPPVVLPVAPVAADVATLPRSTGCVKRRTRLKVKITAPRSGAIAAVSVKVTGAKKARTLKRAGTITLPKLTRARVTVTVTVRFADGRQSTIKRTYRRC